jgi:hypothetical protein
MEEKNFVEEILNEHVLLHKPIEEYLQRECSEEMRLLETVDSGDLKIWRLIAEASEKAFEIGFKLGQLRRE